MQVTTFAKALIFTLMATLTPVMAFAEEAAPRRGPAREFMGERQREDGPRRPEARRRPMRRDQVESRGRSMHRRELAQRLRHFMHSRQHHGQMMKHRHRKPHGLMHHRGPRGLR